MPYGVEPTVKDVFKRFGWAVKPTFVDRDELSPYVLHGEGDLKPKERTGLEDAGHALKNIPVELARKAWRKLKAVFTKF